jgi:Carbamoyl-phosphate synthase L chain, ATP binding domain
MYHCLTTLQLLPGYPVMVRAAYALGGLGSGICDDEAQVTEPISLEVMHTEHYALPTCSIACRVALSMLLLPL